MPWTAEDAKDHNKKAASGKNARQWADVANSVLAKTGDDARSIREANAVIGRQRGRGRASDNVVRKSR